MKNGFKGRNKILSWHADAGVPLVFQGAATWSTDLVADNTDTELEPVPVKGSRDIDRSQSGNFNNHIGSRRMIWEGHLDPWGDDWVSRHSKRGARWGTPARTWKKYRKTQFRDHKVSFRILAPYFAEMEAVLHGTAD